VTLVHRGLVPATVSRGRVSLARHERIVDGADDGMENFITVAGTKYTTARAVAERVTDLVEAHLQRAHVPCRTADTPLDSPARPAERGDGGSNDGVLLEATVPAETADHLAAAYGPEASAVLALAARDPTLARPIASSSPVIGAQLVWAVRREMATRLEDAVIRRTPLGALGYPGDDAVRRAAEIVGKEAGWSDDRKRTEIARVRAFYRIGL
jgi:glycerol-3-phosphate dehydrogenase